VKALPRLFSEIQGSRKLNNARHRTHPLFHHGWSSQHSRRKDMGKCVPRATGNTNHLTSQESTAFEASLTIACNDHFGRLAGQRHDQMTALRS
jgi:hypothetical protein